MKKILFLLLITLIAGCDSKQNDLVVKANIKGLQKGTVYLKRIIDTTMVTVDSVNVNGNSFIELYSALESPEIFFLDLDKKSAEKDRIIFFADKGITQINTTLKNFVYDAKIEGSRHQKILEEYQSVISSMNNRKLDLIKEAFEAQKNKDTVRLNALKQEADKILKRKYLYTVNFALNNKDSEVAPYLALSEIYDARIDLLDTINNSILPEIKSSKYSIELNQYIEKRKQEEK
jgi:uncharacterized protein YcfL